MTHPLDRARLLLSQGRFRAALDLLTSGVPADVDLALGYAEALAETGQPERALAVCNDVGQRIGVRSGAVAQRQRIVGSIELEQGRREAGLASLSSAVSQAEAAGSFAEGARAALRLFTALHSSVGRTRSSDALSVAKRLTLRGNQPTLFADLHMRVGQAEAQSGNFQAGLRHLERAIQILEDAPHAALCARAKLGMSSTLALVSKNDAAKRVAREALSSAELAGSISLMRLSRANLAQLQYRTGELKAAAKNARELLDIVDLPEALRLAVLETYVAALLETGRNLGDSADVGDFLKRMAGLSEPSWVAVEAVPTQARVLANTEGLTAARRVLEAGRALSLSRSHVDSVCRLWFVECELCAVLGSLSDAEDCLGEATLLLGATGSLEMSGLLERSRGLVARRNGAFSAAVGHLGRAERTFAGAGLRVEARRTRLLNAMRTATPESGEGSVTARRRCGHLFSLSAGSFLATLSQNPRLLAGELGRYLEKRNIAKSVRLIEAKPSKLQQPTDNCTIPCGIDGECGIFVGCEQSDDHVARQQLHVLRCCIELATDLESVRSAKESFGSFFELDDATETSVGLYVSSSMRSVLKQLKQVARTDLPVLVMGSTGTGKDVVARDLHGFSRRASKPFIALNVAAVPRDMLEGQLFGYRRGAFTGAVADAKGLIREAEGGTLFIDEIGDLSLDLQPKLLRFLESGEIQPLGERPQRVDVRIVAATNARLETLVKEGRFREDLFYRLNVVSLTVPPLRERREEIPTLIHHFLTRHAHEAGKLIPQLTPRALERLSAYDWPGNVRQLTNELKRVVALADDDELVDLEHLAPGIRDADKEPAPLPSDGSTVTLNLDRDLQGLYDDLERAAITRAMAMAHQNQAESARRLGITRKGLYLKRKRLGLPVDAAEEAEADLTPAR